MKTVYLAREQQPDGSFRLVQITPEDWHAIIKEQEGLPMEQKRHFIDDKIFDHCGEDCLKIEVSLDEWRRWDNNRKKKSREAEHRRKYLHLSLDYARLYFHGEPDVECVAAEFDEFLRSNPVQCIVSPAKRVEGCSEKTLHYYENAVRRLFAAVDCHVTHMTTDDLRNYLSDYQQITQCSKGNIDNIRRIMSSFFAWLEDENYILKSPVRRIHKIRSSKTVKETYTDEALETMRDQCGGLRDLANKLWAS